MQSNQTIAATCGSLVLLSTVHHFRCHLHSWGSIWPEQIPLVWEQGMHSCGHEGSTHIPVDEMNQGKEQGRERCKSQSFTMHIVLVQ